MNKALKAGLKVYTMFDGKVCLGVINEVHSYDILRVPHGTMFARGFKVNWNIVNENSTSVCTKEHQEKEFGDTIFDERTALINSVKDLYKNHKVEAQLSSCKDFYGLELHVGDNVRKLDRNGYTGIIESIYKSDATGYSIPLLKIVDENGFYLAVDEDPRCFTTDRRYRKVTFGGNGENETK